MRLSDRSPAPGGGAGPLLKAESAHFIVYSSGAERTLREYTAQLEDFDNLLRLYHGIKSDDAPLVKLQVTLVSGSGALRIAYPTAPEGTAGFYNAGRHKIIAVSNNSAAPGDLVLFHEYTHHFLQQHFLFGYPSWLNEGYAEYFGATEISPTTINIGKFSEQRVSWLFARDWAPLREMLSQQHWGGSVEHRMMLYAQAWLLTHYMLSTPERREQLGAYLRAIGKGDDPADAMEKATGTGLEVLTKALHHYDKVVYKHVTRPAHPDAEVAITPLTDAANDLLLLDMRDNEPLRKGQAEVFLKAVRDAAAKHPGDAYAQIVLAQAESEYGDVAAAEAILKPGLAAHPDDSRALRLMAECKMKEAIGAPARRVSLFKEARPLLVRAYKVDQTDYEALYDYAHSRIIDADYPNENTLKALGEAHALAPQVDDISMQYATALIRRKKTAEAEQILAPIANDPHGGPRALLAKLMITTLQIGGDAEKAGAAGAGDAPGGRD